MLPQHQEQRQWLERCKLDPDWYVHMVDSLLEDPRHGERWARHWMDVWRYSDWWGLGDQLRNSHKHIWHWRDWIVRSLNRDLPYDQMLRSMLAADELTPNDFDPIAWARVFGSQLFLFFGINGWTKPLSTSERDDGIDLQLCEVSRSQIRSDHARRVQWFAAIFEAYQVRIEMLPGEPIFHGTVCRWLLIASLSNHLVLHSR